jgi:hypothetical protein
VQLRNPEANTQRNIAPVLFKMCLAVRQGSKRLEKTKEFKEEKASPKGTG